MRRPVKEPGPDIKVISVISCQVLPFSFNLSRINSRSFSARSLAKTYLYSLSSSFKIVSGVLVSRNNFIRRLYHKRTIYAVRDRLRLPSSTYSILTIVLSLGSKFETVSLHSMIVMVFSSLIDSLKSSVIRPGSWRR